MIEDRVTYTEAGDLDEIVGSRFAHLERISNKRWFLTIGHADGTETAIWFTSKNLPDLIEKRPAPAKQSRLQTWCGEGG